MLQKTTLKIDKGDAAIVIGEKALSPFVVVCEHAGWMLPEALGDLGMSMPDLHSHVAWDPGAAVVAEYLAQNLQGTLVKQRYSRLVYDCNRPPFSQDAMRVLSENTQIPGNVNLSEEEKQWRIEHIYHPFHQTINEQLDRRSDPVMVTIHSFTPIYNGVERTVDVGVLHDKDARLADAMLAHAAFDEGVLVQRNEPYGPADGVTHTLVKHGRSRGILNVMVEIKNTLIAEEKSQQRYADQLAQMIKAAVSNITAAG